jgi:hypothetical protein
MSGRVQGVGLRGCVERLLSADVRQDDLRELFFGVREQNGGSTKVHETTHFLAHSTRNQGIVWQEVTDSRRSWP